MKRKSKGLALAALAFALGGSSLRADYIMGPTEVNQILKAVQKARLVIESSAPAAEKQRAQFEMASSAYSLMKLVNAEVHSHGDLQQKLIDFAIARCHDLGLEIQYSKKRELYLYDFRQFREYLKAAPRGEFAADARYALIERDFLVQEAGDLSPGGLAARVQTKAEFLRQFPGFKKRADLEMLLTLDYYELSVLYADQGNPAKSQEFKQLAIEQCRHIVKEFPDTPAAASAQDLLIRLQI